MEDQLTIQYSDSNLYFPNTDNILTNLGFVNPLNIDNYIKRSFSTSHGTTVLTGALVESFTKDHLMNEHFLIYQVTPHPAVTDWGMVTYTPMKKSFLSGGYIAGIIKGMPLIALLLLSIITLMLPPSVAIVLRYISIIGLLITYLYYSYKMAGFLYKTLKNTGVDYRGVNVLCAVPDDLININDATVDYMQTLFSSTMVTKVIHYEGSWYIKQSLSSPTFWSVIASLFPSSSMEIPIEDTVISTAPGLMDLSFIPTLPSSHVS